ncbi:hypothetical protein Ancab_039331 [Ancistrocladus abbreviatus]
MIFAFKIPWLRLKIDLLTSVIMKVLHHCPSSIYHPTHVRSASKEAEDDAMSYLGNSFYLGQKVIILVRRMLAAVNKPICRQSELVR